MNQAHFMISPARSSFGVFGDLNQSVRLVSVDLSNRLVGAAINVSCGFESQAEGFLRKSLETLDTLV